MCLPELQFSNSIAARIKEIRNDIAYVQVKKVVEEGGIKPKSNFGPWLVGPFGRIPNWNIWATNVDLKHITVYNNMFVA